MRFTTATAATRRVEIPQEQTALALAKSLSDGTPEAGRLRQYLLVELVRLNGARTIRAEVAEAARTER
jgi:hypothetical protein